MATKTTTKEKVVAKPEYIYQYGWVIKNPKITEKATKLAEANVYTFEVHPKANKKEIMMAITHIYGLIPLQVRTVNIHGSVTVKRNIKGRTRAMRKAYVYLKKGDTISLI